MEVSGDSSARNRCWRQRFLYAADAYEIGPVKWNWGKLSGMVDIDLIVQTLRQHGHRVDHVISVPDNAGEYELTVDGTILNLEEARQVLEEDEAKK
jgi:hypothetical protein